MEDAAQIEKALHELKPCSTRDLFDYLQSDLAYYRGLYIKSELSINKIRRALDKIVDSDRSIVKFNCTSGTKIRYGTTSVIDYPKSEARYLYPSGTIHACVYCSLPVFKNNSKIFHFPGRCEKYIDQTDFKLVRYEDSKAIISDNFVIGVIDNKEPYKLRLPQYINPKGSGNVLSELWYINEIAREKRLIPKGKILPIYAIEKFRKPRTK